MNTNDHLSVEDLKVLNTNKGLRALLSQKPYNLSKALRFLKYEQTLKELQVELIRMQSWVIEQNERIMVVFEGRDFAGKSGAIRRITERMNPRHFRIVALPKPNNDEKNQWYFQRYVAKFPKAGEIVFFDRSWYNRAIVEPVNKFCSEQAYQIFMSQVNDFEKMISEPGVRILKIYLSISKTEQANRLAEMQNNPLKHGKLTEVDHLVQELWEEYTSYKEKMFENSKKGLLQWKIINANRKTEARIEIIKHLLEEIPYSKGKEI
jgi:polyphosphate kinase 2